MAPIVHETDIPPQWALPVIVPVTSNHRIKGFGKIHGLLAIPIFLSSIIVFEYGQEMQTAFASCGSFDSAVKYFVNVEL